ncbi:hypothetical protein BN1723_015280 [Verticillium longisporum]|uniref:Uncharacterized protein n=1 Tax=Verticillium longisporum TaxID=100787 RepID=A0A0G4MV03_VERLO|nr:hypothetical protein BN1723_015280 [Verticillium longisporum]
MSLFGTSPTEESPGISAAGAPSNSLFDEGHPSNKSNSSLFADDDFSGDGGGSPWDMPTPRRQKTRADVLRTLLPTSDAPDSYIDTFDTVVQEDGSNGRVNASGVAKTAFNIYSSVLPFQLVAVARHVFFAFGRGDSSKYI